MKFLSITVSLMVTMALKAGAITHADGFAYVPVVVVIDAEGKGSTDGVEVRLTQAGEDSEVDETTSAYLQNIHENLGKSVKTDKNSTAVVWIRVRYSETWDHPKGENASHRHLGGNARLVIGSKHHPYFDKPLKEVIANIEVAQSHSEPILVRVILKLADIRKTGRADKAATAAESEPGGTELVRKAAAPVCEDSLKGKVKIDPQLESKFFAEAKKSYQWHIVERDGKLEDTLDGVVDKEDRIQAEHTANCVSSHQGEHVMEYCDAQLDGGVLVLNLWGGLPAYASSLRIEIDSELDVKCSFEAVYPALADNLAWRIKKKEVRLKEAKIAKGSRLNGWISVKFEESAVVDGKTIWTPHKIEGYIKPVVE